LSGGIHWLPQMVRWVERCWRESRPENLTLRVFAYARSRV